MSYKRAVRDAIYVVISTILLFYAMLAVIGAMEVSMYIPLILILHALIMLYNL